MSFCSWQVDSHFIWCVGMFFQLFDKLIQIKTMFFIWCSLIKLVASSDVLFYMWLQCYGLMNLKAYGVLNLSCSPRFKSPDSLGWHIAMGWCPLSFKVPWVTRATFCYGLPSVVVSDSSVLCRRFKSSESLGPHIAMGCRPLSSVIRLLCVVQFSIVR